MQKIVSVLRCHASRLVHQKQIFSAIGHCRFSSQNPSGEATKPANEETNSFQGAPNSAEKMRRMRQEKVFEDIIDISPKQLSSGFLVICPTPIGNINDISIRQYETLLNVDIVACEDTRRVGKLFKMLKQRKIDEKINKVFKVEVSPTTDLKGVDGEEEEQDMDDDSHYIDWKTEPKNYEQTKDKAKKILNRHDTFGMFANYKGDPQENDQSTYGLDDEYIKFLRQKINQSKENKGRGLLVSYHQHNEEIRIPRLIQAMKYGLKVALVSDAGTPTISDPGFRLVNHALKEGILIEPLPGPTSVVVALSASGFPADKFVFEGFVSKTMSNREERLLKAKDLKSTCVVFESPNRLLKTLLTVEKIFGDKQLVYIGFEISKLHERHLRGAVREIYDKLNMPKENDDWASLKGEVTLIIAPYSAEFNYDLAEQASKPSQEETLKDDTIVQVNVDKLLNTLMEKLEASGSELAELASSLTGINKNKVAARLIDLKHPANTRALNNLLGNIENEEAEDDENDPEMQAEKKRQQRTKQRNQKRKK